MKTNSFFPVVTVIAALAIIAISLLMPVTVFADTPWFGQGCGTAYTGPGGIKAGGYSPQSLSQDQRQWLFEVFGNAGYASVGYGGQTCPWQQSQPNPPHQAWFGQGCGTSYTGPGSLRAGGYSPQNLSQDQRQWLFEVFGNEGYASVGYGGQTCGWQTQSTTQTTTGSSGSTQSSASTSTGANTTTSGGFDGDCNTSPSPNVSVGTHARVTYTDGSPNRLRTKPSRSATVIARVPEGTQFNIIDGPVCNQGWRWWKVSIGFSTGWMASGGGGTYWIEPAAGGSGEEWARISADAVYIPHPIICAPETTHAWVQFKIPGAIFKYEGMHLESMSSYGRTLASHSQLLSVDANTNPRVIRMGLSCWDILKLSPYQALVLSNRNKWKLVYRVR